MAVRFNRGFIALGISLLLLPACSGPKLLVDGLTLPPGSTEDSIEVSEGPAALPFPIPGEGEVKKSVVVQFSNSAGWDSVAEHIDACMQRAGYSESMSKLENLPGGGSVSSELGELNKMARTYLKTGGKYMVMLYNNNWMGSLGKLAGVNQDGSDFSLTVVEFKGDG